MHIKDDQIDVLIFLEKNIYENYNDYKKIFMKMKNKEL